MVRWGLGCETAFPSTGLRFISSNNYFHFKLIHKRRSFVTLHEFFGSVNFELKGDGGEALGDRRLRVTRSLRVRKRTPAHEQEAKDQVSTIEFINSVLKIFVMT